MSGRITSLPGVTIHESAWVDAPADIGEGTRIWHFCHIQPGARLGTNCSLGQNVNVGNDVQIGNNVKIQNNVSVYSGCTLEDDVFLGPSCVLTNVTNPRSQVNRKAVYEETLLRRGATVGANATIICGITLGRYCFIAAGSVVTRSVPDYALMVGNPARRKGWMSRHGHKLSGPDGGGVMTCPESGLRYQLTKTGGDADSASPDSASTEILRCLDVGEDEPLPEELATGTKSYRQYKES